VHPVLFHLGSILIPSYGAIGALGVLVALMLAQRTARITALNAALNAAEVWNLCVIALFAALIGARLLLIVVNWSTLRNHPSWVLSLAMVHHPLVAAAAALTGALAALIYARRQRMPLWTTADALAAPLAVGLAFEQIGALLAGADYGTETGVRWAVTYTSVLAARWSGTPLGVPLQPVQVYAALAYLTIGIALLILLPLRRRAGDVAGLGLMAWGAAVFMTELVRDPEGRGTLLNGALDGPQVAAIALVLLGAVVLRERKAPDKVRAYTPIPQKETETMRHEESHAKNRDLPQSDEAANG
jgi:phosphatidylglycerol---prolipoprotein diacylglyceryl transferase